MRHLLLALTLLLGAPLLAQEKITLTTPIIQTSIADYAPIRLTIQVSPSPVVQVWILATNGKEEAFEYPCKNGCTAMNTDAKVAAAITVLNTANLSTRTLWRRLFDRLVADFPERFPGGATVQ